MEKMNIGLLDSIKDDTQLLETVKTVMEQTDMNGNSLKNLVRYLREIKLRDSISCDEIMQKIDAENIFANTDFNRKTKSEEIIRRLYAQRYPLWNEKQTQFTKLRNRFRALTGGDIEFPEFAEGNSIKVTFTIRKNEDISKMADTVSKSTDIIEESLEKVRE